MKVQEKHKLDLEAITRLTTLEVRKILAELAAEAKKDPDPVRCQQRLIARQPDIIAALTRASVMSHLMGRRRSFATVLTRPGRPQRRRLSLLSDKALELLRLRLDLSPVDLEKISSEYGKTATAVGVQFGEQLNKKLLESVAKSVEEGDHVRDTGKRLAETLSADGQAVTANVLETMSRTQLSLAYNGGRWAANQDPDIDQALWGYRYEAIIDDRTRDEHIKLHGTQLPKDDPFWTANWPPNGYNCRCTIVEVWKGEVDSGTKVEPPPDAQPDPGWGFSPAAFVPQDTVKATFPSQVSIDPKVTPEKEVSYPGPQPVQDKKKAVQEKVSKATQAQQIAAYSTAFNTTEEEIGSMNAGELKIFIAKEENLPAFLNKPSYAKDKAKLESKFKLAKAKLEAELKDKGVNKPTFKGPEQGQKVSDAHAEAIKQAKKTDLLKAKLVSEKAKTSVLKDNVSKAQKQKELIGQKLEVVEQAGRRPPPDDAQRIPDPVKWQRSLATGEKGAIRAFTGMFSSEIRSFERGDLRGIRPSRLGRLKKQVERINSALNKAPTYKGEIYRGLRLDKKDIRSFLQQDVIEMNCMSSFSKSREVASDFASAWEGRQVSVLMQVVDNKKGLGVDIQALSQVNREQEVLVPKGQRFEVVSRKHYPATPSSSETVLIKLRAVYP